MGISDVPMKSVQLIIAHAIDKFLDPFDGYKIPGCVQHESSVGKQGSINHSARRDDLYSIPLFIVGDKLTQSFQSVTGSEESVPADFSSDYIPSGFEVHSVSFRGFKSQSLLWVVNYDLCNIMLIM